MIPATKMRVASFLDITEHKKTEERLRLTLETTNDGMWDWNIPTGKAVFSPRYYRILGFEPDEFPENYDAWRRLVHPDDVDWAEREINEHINENTGYAIEIRMRTKSGDWRWILTRGMVVERDVENRPIRMVGTHSDITERKQAEEEVRTSHFQLRALYKRLQQIREEDRIAIAREIHDEIGGGLTGLKMDLSWLLHKMGNADMDEERVALMDKIHTANALIDHMIQVVRRVSTHLRPSVLDDLGLIAALEWQLSEFTKRTEIQHELTTTFEYVNMEEPTAIAVFRIFQEALTNVMRHSGATKVVVVLREDERSLFGDESLILEIRDNGRGITEEEILNPESLGLLGIKERVLVFKGEISIRGKPGGGTSVILKIPRIQGEPS